MVAAAGVASHPLLFVELFDIGDALPLTRRSKSSGVAPFVASNVVPVTPPKPRKSSFTAGADTTPPFVTASSCNFFVCSSSTLRDSDLISCIKLWNCLRSNSGPKLIFHRIGKISIATNSASATSPMTRRTPRAAIITAGSLVLMALMRGTIFSCIVYLSSALDEEAFFFSGASPSRPSSPELVSLEPPHNMTKARQPRTLIAKLFVLLKTVATTGKSSFLIVLKSRIGNTSGSPRNAASTSDGVEDSIVLRIMGRISCDRLVAILREDCTTKICHRQCLIVKVASLISMPDFDVKDDCGRTLAGASSKKRAKHIPSLNSFPEQFSAIRFVFSKTTIKPASLDESFSWLCFAFSTKISLSFGRTLSPKARRDDGKRLRILNTFWRMSERSSLSFNSSSKAGNTFFSMTDFGKDGRTLFNPLMNEDFSLGVLAGKASRNRMVEIRMLSKYWLS